MTNFAMRLIKCGFATKSATDIKKEILESIGLTEKDMSAIKSFRTKGDGYAAIVDCNRVPGFKKGEDSQFKLITQSKDSHSEKGFDTIQEARDAEKEFKSFAKEEKTSGDWIYEYLTNKITDIGSKIEELQSDVDNLTEASNLEWELYKTFDYVSASNLTRLEKFLGNDNFIKIYSDELTQNFIYFNNSIMIAKIDKQLFVYGLVGGVIESKLDNFLKTIPYSTNQKEMTNFAHSDSTTRVVTIELDPATTNRYRYNRIIDTLKSLDEVDEVKLVNGYPQLTLNTEISEVGIHEIIDDALAKVASNLTYKIIESI